MFLTSPFIDQAITLIDLDASSQHVFPSGANISTAAIRSNIGVSRWYASRIRQGHRPHPRHWQALAELVKVSSDLQSQSR